ncbi:NAD-dependent epimerase/dehydratase family protein, partial [Pseudomonadales bacterium]|nr:NAD-dependent epimerase/dehydratase family protein [Pseudomonadales bacterium]
MNYLVTGGCGFLGSNIVRELLRSGEKITIFDNLSRVGSSLNLEWLKTKGNFEFIYGDIRNSNDVERLVKNTSPDIVYHLAGQVAMTTSITNPRLDFEINAMGSFNLLDACRIYAPNSTVIYSSTNKVYGDLNKFNYIEKDTRYECLEKPKGFDESVPLDFQSPYGTSKGAADQYMLDFSRIYGLKTIVFRHSSMFGGRQFATSDQGWVGWFTQQAIETKNQAGKRFTISGNGKQVRDLLFSDDCVNLYINAAQNIDILTGKAFNIGGGYKNSS